MENTSEAEIIAALEMDRDEMPFEEHFNPENSPLNQPVIKDGIADNSAKVKEPTPKPQNKGEYIPPTDGRSADSLLSDKEHNKIPNDGVEEQEIGSENFDENAEEDGLRDNLEIPSSQAKQAANTLIGVADMLVGITGSFFVKIKKHKEFYDYDEVIEVIDEQNEKNIERLKLNEDEKALLRPIVMAVAKEKAKQLSPTEQLMAAAVTILVKKGKDVMEIKAENTILSDKLRDLVLEQNRASSRYQPEEDSQVVQQSEEQDDSVVQESDVEDVETVEIISEPSIPESVLEVNTEAS